MNTQLLIDHIVRQTMVLIAQLATSGGTRAPLAHVADRVFLELSRELEAQGLSRQVSADMFGVALRSYRRRIQRVTESATEQGRSLWSALVDYLPTDRLVSRGEVFARFPLDDELQVRAILTDLRDAGLILQLGKGSSTAYRSVTCEELTSLDQAQDGLPQLLWLWIYREGPLSLAEITDRAGVEADRVDQALEHLTHSGQIAFAAERYSATEVVVQRTEPAGWEAAMLDHFQALVKTLCARLSGNADSNSSGGSTYSFDVSPEHPLAVEVYGTLDRVRGELSALRQKVETFNRQQPAELELDLVTVYVGQHVRTAAGEETNE